MKVSKILLPGKDNAIAGAKLVEIMGLKELRDLTQLVECERQAGCPICASNSSVNYGYYLASNASELWNYICSLDRRIHHVATTRRHLEATFLRMAGQDQLEGY